MRGSASMQIFFNTYVLHSLHWLNLQMQNHGYRGPTVKEGFGRLGWAPPTPMLFKGNIFFKWERLGHL